MNLEYIKGLNIDCEFTLTSCKQTTSALPESNWLLIQSNPPRFKAARTPFALTEITPSIN